MIQVGGTINGFDVNSSIASYEQFLTDLNNQLKVAGPTLAEQSGQFLGDLAGSGVYNFASAAGSINYFNLLGADTKLDSFAFDGAGTYVFNVYDTMNDGSPGQFNLDTATASLSNGASLSRVFFNFVDPFAIDFSKNLSGIGTGFFGGNVIAPTSTLTQTDGGNRFIGTLSAQNVTIKSGATLEYVAPDTAVIPLPPAVWLLGSGMAALFLGGRLKSRRANA